MFNLYDIKDEIIKYIQEDDLEAKEIALRLNEKYKTNFNRDKINYFLRNANIDNNKVYKKKKLLSFKDKIEELAAEGYVDGDIVNYLKEEHNFEITERVCYLFREKYNIKINIEKRDIRTKEKLENIFMDKYGVKNPFQAEEVKEKIKQTNLELRGVENPFQSEEVKEKIKQTNLERRGVEHPMHSEEVKEKIKQTNLKRRGVEHTLQDKEVREKGKETLLKNYGVEHPMHSEEVKEKLKQTNLKIRGVENPFQAEEVKEKIKQTNLKNIGVEHPMYSEEVKEKIKQTNLKRRGVEYTSQDKEVKDKVKMNYYSKETLDILSSRNNFELYCQKHLIENNGLLLTRKIIADKLGISLSTIGIYIRKYKLQDYFSSNNSYLESLIENKFKELNVNVEHNIRTIITPYEIDIYLPQYKIGIEINPTYTHNSTKGTHWGTEPKEIDYHYKKYKKAKEASIQLIQLYDWDFDDTEKLYKYLKSLIEVTNINAEAKEIVEISKYEAEVFCNKNSFFKFNSEANYYGVKVNNELVQVGLYKNNKVIISTKLGYYLNKEFLIEYIKKENNLDTIKLLININKFKLDENLITKVKSEKIIKNVKTFEDIKVYTAGYLEVTL